MKKQTNLDTYTFEHQWEIRLNLNRCTQNAPTWHCNTFISNVCDLVDLFIWVIFPHKSLFLNMLWCHCMHDSLGTCNIQIIQYWQVTVTSWLTAHTILNRQPLEDHKDFSLSISWSNSTSFFKSIINHHGCGGSGVLFSSWTSENHF